MLEKLTRQEFIYNVVEENSKIIQEYMEEKNITLKSVTDEIWGIISALPQPLHVEANREPVKLKKFNKHLGVKLDYYKIGGNPNNRELENYCKQCTLTPTPKGREIYIKYKRVSSR